MSLPDSSSNPAQNSEVQNGAVQSASFDLLDEHIQHFIWQDGWDSLREVQELAIQHIVPAQSDVIVAAATAAGKTEAAFFPALTHILKHTDDQGLPQGLIVYVSPLKALINDQFGRLDRLCDTLDVPVWPWHGDMPASLKKRFMAKRTGVLLITPESLEALLCNKGTQVSYIFEHLQFLIIDELHAFIGQERGKQLQSLLHRIESARGQAVPRIGLSATLGDMRMAADFLRPGCADQVVLVQAASGSANLKVLLKGYEEPLAKDEAEEAARRAGHRVVPPLVASHLYKVLLGSNNLIFPNSRKEVERYTHLLNTLCEQNQVPRTYWPHHGSLSKTLREETEQALKQKDVPASAVCTNTLELGIDIGAVKSVVQIGPSPSVASLRQRLGRSGRRAGEAAILRGYCIEDEIGANPTWRTLLRLNTVQMTAMVELLLENWFEPPRSEGLHLSTLVQQILSTIAQQGGVKAPELYQLLCDPNKPGTPFASVSKAEFVELLKALGEREFLMQDADGSLLHGPKGEQVVNHYSFYAAFAEDFEFSVIHEGKVLGSLPLLGPVKPKQRVLFGGRTWLIEHIDMDKRAILVRLSPGGAPPDFQKPPGYVHTFVRQQMYRLLASERTPVFLDAKAQQFLSQARQAFKDKGLDKQCCLEHGGKFLVFTWLGDEANAALGFWLETQGFQVDCLGPFITVDKPQLTRQGLLATLQAMATQEPPPLPVLLEEAENLVKEKWDSVLSDALLQKTYASSHLNFKEARRWLSTLNADQF